MGFDVIERFFKLTLDNVYRFLCSVLFLSAVVGWFKGNTPSIQFGLLLDWLAIPSVWLAQASWWLTQREEVVGLTASLLLTVAVWFILVNGLQSRAGSTALLSTTILAETGQLLGVVTSAGALAVLPGLGALIVRSVHRRVGSPQPEWTSSVGTKYVEEMSALMCAAAYVLSPLGWLISQESYQRRRGTGRFSPLYIAKVEP